MNKKIVEYKMVVAGTSKDLSDKVSKFLRTGWELYGSPLQDMDGDDYFLFCQAVVQTEPSEMS